jgi:hypothetical protein
MESVLLAAMITTASTLSPANEPAAAAALDQRCFRLMAELAEDEDPRIRSLGRTAAQYFLGRIDASAPNYNSEAALETPAPQGADRTRLLGDCGHAMQAGGRDFRSIGEALAPRSRPTI